LSSRSSATCIPALAGSLGPWPHCSGLPSCSRPAEDRRAMADSGGKEDYGQERDDCLVAKRLPMRPSTGPVRWESIRQIPRTTMAEPRLDHGQPLGDDESVPVRFPVDSA
jgi:hypothetical protein